MGNSDRTSIWDERYAEPGYSFGSAPNVFLASQDFRFKKGQRAIAPGDGEGRNGVWLAEQGLIVDSVDASAKGVEKALRLAAERNVQINAFVADLLAWNWPVGAYDVVASIFLHFHARESQIVHRHMLECLKPGGIVILECYNPRHIAFQKTGSVGGSKDPTMLMDSERLRHDFANAEIELLEDIEVDISEGKRHQGRSSVTRMIARRR